VILALAAQATLIAVIFTAVIVCAARREHHARTLSQGLSAARPKLRDLLADPEARREGALAIACLPVELRIALFSEFAGTLLGEERERLASLAQTTGLTAHAEARCRSRRWWLRLQGVRLLTLIGSNQEFLPVLLEDSDPEVRAATVAWSVRYPQPATPQRLIDLLGDEQPLVSFAAQSALLKLAGSAVPALAAALQSIDRGYLEAALRVAVGLSDMRLLPPGLAYRKDSNPAVRALIAQLAGTVGGERAITVLLEMLGDGSPEVRAAAAHGLGRLGHWPAGQPLLGALADPAWVVRREAALALRSLGATGLLLLRSALDASDPFARDMARHTLDLPDTDAQRTTV
jgi:HEAT repeats